MKSSKKQRKQKQPRSAIALEMILTCRSAVMRDRRNRRAKDARQVRESFGVD